MSSLPRPLQWPPIFPLDKGLVAWYAFDDRSGAVLRDRSGKRNHGTLVGPTWVAGRRGSALSFDGLNDYVSLPVAFLSGLSEATCLVSLKPGSYLSPIWGSWAFRASDIHDYDVMSLTIREDTDISVFFSAGTDYNKGFTGAGWSEGVQIHVAGVFDGTNVKVYFNGAFKGQQACSGTLLDVVTFVLGNYNGTLFHFHGLLGAVMIYNRALNAAEIKRHAESELMLVRH